MASPPQVVEDQARLLEDALNVVRQQTQLMRRCLESPGKLMDALKCRYVNDDRPVSVGLCDCDDYNSCALRDCLVLISLFRNPAQHSFPNLERAV